ncbi:KTSC domain-containing protein [Acidovorax temperans]|uniref:KTSC domain-containing protein n=1 Tax=Acidovorax temperans TaxID=80878 RepID=UPI001427A267
MVETHSFPGSGTLVKGTYDTEKRLLRLWFTSAPFQPYDYPGVPAHTWSGLKSAVSAGTYYNQNIRDQYGDQRPPSGRSRRL